MAIEGEGGDGAAGEDTIDTGAADAGGEGGDGGAGAAEGGEGGGNAGGEGGADADADAGAAAPWYGELSADNGTAGTLSDADWMKNKGYADAPAMVKAMRGLESKLAGKSGIELPGEDATPEQIAAFHKAIGVPDDAAGYDVAIPEGYEADMAVIDPLRAVAHQAGIPKAGFDVLAKAFVDAELDRITAEVTAADQARDAKYAEWGEQKDQNLALFQRGVKTFGLDAGDVAKLQQVVGAGKVLDMGLMMGRVSGEDGFIPGTPKSFGIDPSDARNELTRLESDKAFIAKLQSGDKAAKARHERLIAVISADDARKAAEDRVS